MNVKVKICGIRSMESALAAVEAEADFLGFNFVPNSKRFVSPSHAKSIINNMKGRVKIIGVFQNADSAYINELIDFLGLDFVQLHGNEDMEFVNKINGPAIKAICLPSGMDTDKVIEDMQKYQVNHFLIDRERQGEGDMINIETVKTIAKKFSIFLAGGLNPDNIAEIVDTVQPYAVDVASGIETDGLENTQKIKEFIKNAKGVSI